MTVPQNDPGFLNVPLLLEASEPRQRMAWMRLGVSGFVMAILLGWFFGRQGEDRGVLSILLSVGLTLILGVVAANGYFTVRRSRQEQSDLETIEELIQLRRWPQSALAVQAFLSKPVQSIVGRAQAVLCMAMILARYHRFEEAVVVYDRVLAEVPLDDASAHAVRLGRAMAMLSEERLVDADRAIADLRRGSRGMESPGLALLEIYRDVKTGHPQEAIQMFHERLEVMRKTLGHRLADAWGLVARAYDLVGRTDEARAAFDNATHLAPLIELKRRYPEIGALAEKYSPAPTPAGVEEMLSADVTISRFRRDLAIASILRYGMVITAAACVIVAPLFQLHDDGALILAMLGGIWMLMSYRSMQGTRLAAQSPSLIAAGQYEQAEDRIDTALKSFSLFRTAKLLSLHHLALLRHAQRQWREAAMLCRALLSQRLTNLQSLCKTSLLLLADSSLQMEDLRGAYDAMNGLYGHRLNLNETLTLQILQLDYGSRIGAWEAMLQGLSLKVQLSELMPTLNAARSQAYLALAAKKTNRVELARWLRRRAELLADAGQITPDRPILAEMFAQPW